jgi:hypothetical protein
MPRATWLPLLVLLVRALPALTLSVLVLPVLALALGRPAAASDDDWRALAQRVDLTDARAVRAARQGLEAREPDFWFLVRPRGPLLSALARDLAPDEVAALLDAAATPERLETLGHNLAARDDLADMVLARGALARITQETSSSWNDVAAEALVHGAPGLATALLANPALGMELAEDLADLTHPQGLHLLADVVAGAATLPADARARLGDLRPDLENRYLGRALGAPRIEALARVAREDADPALRVLAARLLHASLDPATRPVLVEAYRSAASWRIDADEWEQLGKNHGLLAGLEGADAWQRRAVLHGHVVLGHVRAAEHPEEATRLAQDCRDLWSRSSGDDARGLLLRCLDAWGYVFVDGSRSRPVAAAPWLELLGEIEREGAGTSGVALLARAVARRARQELHAPYDRARHTSAPAAPTRSPPAVVLALRAKPRPDAIDAQDVAAWLAQDPDHLLLGAFEDTYRTFQPDQAARVLRLYPEATFARLLDAPTDGSRAPGGSGEGLGHAQGDAARLRVLRILALDPSLCVRVCTPARVAGWPRTARTDLGRLTATGGLPYAPDDLKALLDDPEVAVGYAHGALTKPKEPALDFATRVLAGLAGSPALRTALADVEEGGPSVRLGPVEDDWPGARFPLDAALVDRLDAVLAAEPDPHLRDWIANRLALSGTPKDVAVLVRHAERIAVTDTRGRHPLTDIDLVAADPACLDLLLGYVAEGARPHACIEVLDSIVDEVLDEDLDRDEPALQVRVERVLGWIAKRVPSLSADRVEGIVRTFGAVRYAASDPRLARIVEALQPALEALTVPGVRERLRKGR